MISTSDSVIERISGSAEGKSGYRDGTTDEALFNHPKKITLDSDGNIYVADPRNGAVRMITRTGKHANIVSHTNPQVNPKISEVDLMSSE